MFAMFLYITLYVQDVLGYSPLAAGLRFLPLTLLSFFVAPVAGKLSARIPIRVLLGVGLTLVGVALLLMHGVKLGDSWTTLLAGFLVAGVGIGMVNPGIAQTAIGVVQPQKAGRSTWIILVYVFAALFVFMLLTMLVTVGISLVMSAGF